MSTQLPPRRRGTLCLAALTLAACGGGDSSGPSESAQGVASPTTCAARPNDNISKLLECVTVAGVREHQMALQQIADANNGTRASGTPGYAASVDYVKGKLEAAGYAVTLSPFDFTYVPPAELRRVSPVPRTFLTGGFTASGTGTVTAAVQAVDVNFSPPFASTSGCEAADFAGFAPGNIALIQRGTCTFAVKAANAQAAGAAAVVIFNQGNTPDREPLIVGTLLPPVDPNSPITIPVVGASFADGFDIANVPSSILTVRVDPAQQVTQYNVLAESRDGDPNNVVMVGAHLDSVQAGPGINDNGSGSASILEVAEQMAKVKPRNKLRFAWWGGEESGLVGSTAYVAGLSAEARAKIALYLNFDMVGSPNSVFFIYDGDNSDGVGAGAGPDGSAAIEKTFEKYYTDRGIPFKGTDFTGRSDYGPFIAQGIPSGGLFTGAEGVKTAQEASIFGGTAGIAYDPCYHQACDTLDNYNPDALQKNAGAIAYATLKYAMSTTDVNAQKGKGNFKKLVVPYPPEPAQ